MATVLQIKPSRVESILSAIKELSPDERETLTKQVLAISQLETPPVPPSELEDTYISISKKTLVHALYLAFMRNLEISEQFSAKLNELEEVFGTRTQLDHAANRAMYEILDASLTPKEFRMVDIHYLDCGFFTSSSP